MSSTIGIGVPVPKMLPITGTWTLPFTAYLAFLSNRVVMHRVKNEKWIGESTPEDTDLQVDSRAHANFLENVPLAFTLVAIAELNGGNRKVLNVAMATLFVLRLVHAELGLRRENNVGHGRPIGYFGTQGFLLGMAAYGTWLVKGYWGF